jgi:hypothetical protein
MSKKPSASMDRTMFASHFKALGPDDPVLNTLEMGQNCLFSAMTNIFKVQEKNAANTMQTDLYNMKATADFTGKVSVAALKTADQRAERAKASIKTLEREINAPLNQNGAHAAETRTLLRELKHEERRKFLTNAVRNDDTEALAAVLTAPAYLSGIDNLAADHFREQYHRENNAQALTRIEHINGAIELLYNAGQIFSGECGKIMHPPGLERARKLEQAAQEASSAQT